MNYDRLEKVILDTVREEQIKLGYERETIRLYYPMSSLAHILGENITQTPGMDEIMKEFCRSAEDKLGKLKVTHTGDRYCIIIPPDGAAYVHEAYEDNPFLTLFIEAVRKQDCTLDRLLEIFHSFSDQVACEKSGTEEFDYVIYFKDNKMDDYRYCIKFEHGHTTYHRFTREDYEQL